jgi:cold shock CspA family protein
MRGTVSEFDVKAGVGIIEADDGELVFFNRGNLQDFDAPLLPVGTRVKFQAHESELGAHADFVLVTA